MRTQHVFLGPARPLSPVQKLFAFVILLGLVALVLTFAVVLLPFLLAGAAVVWWKTRHVRRQLREMQAQMQQMRDFPPRGEVFEGEIIEGEFVREHRVGVRTIGEAVRREQ